MKNRIYWLETLSGPPLPIKPDPLADRCDVAVIGGGLTGLSAAFHLALKGCSVVVLEGNRMGEGASSRNAGMAITGLTLFPRELIARYGRESALDLYRIGTAAVDFLETWIEDEKIDCDFKRYGALCAAWFTIPSISYIIFGVLTIIGCCLEAGSVLVKQMIESPLQSCATRCRRSSRN
jgi:hypothetical protein